MKKKTKPNNKREKETPKHSTKGHLTSLSEYFGSYLSALQVVSARQ